VSAQEPQSDEVSVARDQAALLLEARRYREALERLARALASAPDDAVAWCLTAQARLGLNEVDEGLDAAMRAHRAAPHEEWPLRLLSETRHQSGKHEGAAQAARHAVRLDPSNWMTHAQLARAASPLPHHADEAWHAATTATRLAPLEAEAHATLAELALNRNDRRTAERAYREALRLDPHNVSALNGMARIDLLRGRLVEAVRGFSAVGRVDPQERAVPHNMRATVQLWLRRTHLGLVAAWVLLSELNRSATDSSGVLPSTAALSLVFLALLIWWTARTVGRLPSRLRATLIVVMRAVPSTFSWFAALVVAAFALIAMAWGPTPDWRHVARMVFGGAIMFGWLASWSPRIAARRRRGNA